MTWMSRHHRASASTPEWQRVDGCREEKAQARSRKRQIKFTRHPRVARLEGYIAGQPESPCHQNVEKYTERVFMELNARVTPTSPESTKIRRPKRGSHRVGTTALVTQEGNPSPKNICFLQLENIGTRRANESQAIFA